MAAEASRGRKRKFISAPDTEDSIPSINDLAPPGLAAVETPPKAAEATNMDHETLASTTKIVDDLRDIVTCKICFRLLYEPYTTSCGHTYCYSCLRSWFADRQKRNTCPDCRAPVKDQPAPAYLVREMTQKLIQQAELLPEGETVEQHWEWQKEELAAVDKDRANTDVKVGGLFGGRFNKPDRPWKGPTIRDEEDGVERCPYCAWEIEEDDDGFCNHCGFEHGGYLSDSEDDADPRWNAYYPPPQPWNLSSELDGDLEDQDHDQDFLSGEVYPNGYDSASQISTDSGSAPSHPDQLPRSDMQLISSDSEEGNSSEEEDSEEGTDDESESEGSSDSSTSSIRAEVDRILRGNPICDPRTAASNIAELGSTSPTAPRGSSSSPQMTHRALQRRQALRRTVESSDSESEGEDSDEGGPPVRRNQRR